MVSSLSLAGMVFTLLVSFLVPIGLVVYFYRKERIYLPAVLVGALIFLVFQLLTRIPLLNYLAGMDWFEQVTQSLLLLVIFFALSAAVFEECGRYLGGRFLLSKHLSWKNGVAFGIGHGGFEAMALVGTTNINNLVMSIMVNTGNFDSMYAPQLGEMANQIKQQLIQTDPALFFVAGIERLAAIAIHIALSLIVIYGIKQKKLIYLGYAILLHTLVNVPAALQHPLNISIWFIEAYVLIFAIAGIYFIRRIKPAMQTD